MNFRDWLKRTVSRDQSRAPVAITWGQSSVGRSINRTGVILKRQIWIWPILAVVLLSLIGLLVRQSIESTMREGLESQLQTLVDVEGAMLDTWYTVQKSNAQSIANNLSIRQTIYPLLDAPAGPAAPVPAETSGTPATPAAESPDSLRAKLDKLIGPSITAHRYSGYIVADKKKRIVAASYSELIGQQEIAEYESFLSQALDGNTVVSAPHASFAAIRDDNGRVRTGVATMVVASPIRDDSFQVVGVLGLRINPEDEFSRIMRLGQFGSTGETYAFDKTGRMVSDSRFNDELVIVGLLPDDENIHSNLRILIRDPGGNVTTGYRPAVRRRDLPLTFAAAEAIGGRAGVNVEGYRDYRGVPVVGAWNWLPDGDVGIATEMDYAEAFRPLYILRWTFWALFALLALSALAIFIFSVLLARARREAQKAAIEAQQVGQYKLDQKLGSGGMGVVYRAHHAMLRRPTAVKMLDPDRVTEGAIERFEREVQLTSQLNNPNTVAIYDYGRTPEGLFYYAMEFLDGIDLQVLVERYGPQPPSRVIHILQQVCGSLYEAHSLGLVHRDIKPANIMLNRRGGQPDVVKVLDFGLVKAMEEKQQASLTQNASLTGTPLYMSPEAIQLPDSVDARSDIYAVGAVGYYLLTGMAVFDADSVVDLCQKHVNVSPTPPSERAKVAIPEELESAILACLEKSRAKRPQTARDLSLLIGRCHEALEWSIEDSDAWWGRHERGQASVSLSGANMPITASKKYDMTIDQV